MKILLFAMMFFILGALLIISNNNLALYNSTNVNTFLGLYYNWIDGIYVNTYTLTGKIIELDWLPKQG